MKDKVNTKKKKTEKENLALFNPFQKDKTIFGLNKGT